MLARCPLFLSCLNIRSVTAIVLIFSGASIGDGQSAVASNIANTTYRLQWWDFTKFDLPEISNGSKTALLSHHCSHVWSFVLEALTLYFFYFFFFMSPVQPLSTFWCRTVRSTTMPAATSLQTVSCWLSSFPAASGGSQTRASWPSTLWRLTTWGRCSTPRDSVQLTEFYGAEKRKFLLMSSCVFLR